MASSSTSEIDTDWYGEFDWPKRENFLPKIEEEDMTNSSTNHFDGEDESSNLKVVSKKKTSRMDILKDVFLPRGYPQSVSSDYMVYQIWDTIQAFCSSITGTLATHAVLKGAGVGDSSATPLAATITWMLKDGAGMIGRILFAWFKGSELDANAKQWRLVADMLNDVAIFMDLLAPLFPHLFLMIMCISSVTRAVVGVAGGATRAAITEHQALKNNMADVSAKDGSQETLVNFIALLVGLVLTPAVADKPVVVWFLFVVFTVLHLLANYIAVTSVVMNSLNRNRFHYLTEAFLKGQGALPPKKINPMEPIIPKNVDYLTAEIGVSAKDIFFSKQHFLSEFQSFKHIKTKGMLRLDCKARKVYIALSRMHDQVDLLKFLYHKEIIEYVIRYRSVPEVILSEGIGKAQPKRMIELATACYNGLATPEEENSLVQMVGVLVFNHYHHFSNAVLIAGWDIRKCQMVIRGWRYSWETDGIQLENDFY